MCFMREEQKPKLFANTKENQSIVLSFSQTGIGNRQKAIYCPIKPRHCIRKITKNKNLVVSYR